MTKREKKQLIKSLREIANEKRDVLKSNRSLSAKLRYLFNKTDDELVALDAEIIQEHLASVIQYVNEKEAAKSPATKDAKNVKNTKDTKDAEKAEKAEIAAQKKKLIAKKDAEKEAAKKEVVNMFPNTFVYELKDAETDETKKVTMTKITDAINNMNDVIKMQDALKSELYVAIYWPKDLLKEYELCLDVPAPKNGFDNEIDVCGIALITSNKSHMYCMSTETEAMYFIRNKELPLLKDRPYRMTSGDTEYEFYTASEYVAPVKVETAETAETEPKKRNSRKNSGEKTEPKKQLKPKNA